MGDPQDAELRALVHRQEVDDLRGALDDARSREARHWTMAALGATPSALVVGLGLLASGSSIELLVAFSVVVAVVEGWRGARSGREARRLERRLAELESDATPPPGGGA